MSSQRTDRPEDAQDAQSKPAPGALSKDTAFHLLQNARRRAVLRYLLAHDQDHFVMRDVAEAVAAWEQETTVRRLGASERQRVYIALYQSHLPKLDEHGIVDYDQERGTIEVRPLVSALEPYLAAGLDAPDADVVSDRATSEATRDEGGLRKVIGLFQ